MDKNLFKGVKITSGFLLTFIVIFGLVSAAGFHYANEIVPGAFQDGDYSFNGKLGVGTDSPDRKLSVNGSMEVISDAIHIGESYSTVNSRRLQLYYDNALGNGVDGAGVVQPVRIGIGETPLLLNPNGGNVGIGTTNPTAKLDVRGLNPSIYLVDSNDANRGLVFKAGNISEGYSMLTTNSVNRDLAIGVDGAIDVFIHDNGNVGIGTINPQAKLDVAGALKVGGSETGYANDDIKAYIQKAMCENRRGVWVDGVGCDEYAYFTDACTYTTCSCNTGYHMCTFPDLFTGGFDSLRRPGYNNPTAYAWIAGNYLSGSENAVFYPWGYNSEYITCNSGSHFMINMKRNSAGYTAWGCYSDTYTSVSAMCCKNNQ